jgi:hypothetical protein
MAQDFLDDAAYLRIRVESQVIEKHPQVEPARRGCRERDPAAHARIGIGDTAPQVRLEPGRLVLEELAERLIRSRADPVLRRAELGTDRR